MKTYFLILSIFLAGCTTSIDSATLMLLNRRIQELESNKSKSSNPKKIEIEMYVTDSLETSIINMNREPVTRKVKIEVIEDQNGNFIIPQNRIIKHYEMK